MKTYAIAIRRTIYFKEVIIKAENKSKAEEKAIETASNGDTPYDGDYELEIINIEKIQ